MSSVAGGDSTLKRLAITGGAAESFMNGGTRRKRRSSARAETRKAEKQEGGSSQGADLQVQASRAAPLSTANSISQASASNASTLAKITTNSAPAPAQSATATATALAATEAAKPAVGGSAVTATAKPVKVILGASKKKTKVFLAPAKVKKVPGLATSGAPVNKTRKVAKKIRMSLGGFGKRVTRANTIRHDAKKQKIEDVKKTLVDAKLVKAESKAPESVLRQMYADYMVIKNRAL